MAQLKLLAYLAEQPRRSTDIASFFDQAPRTVTQAIDALEQNGLVSRSPAPDDRRSKLVQITDAGRATLGLAMPLYDDIVGLAAAVGAGGGMTARLTINYRKPTPLFEPITFRAWLEEFEDRKFLARGEMHHGDVLVSEAEGLFIRPKGFPPGTSAG